MYRSLLVFFILLCCSFHVPQDGPPSYDSQVIKIAESQLGMFLAKIPPGHDSDYGFGENENLGDCQVGKPFRVLNFSQEFYTADLQDNVNYIDIKNEWRVPVMLTRQYRVLLTVAGNPGNLSVTEIGGAELARELQGKAFLADTGDTYCILRVFPLSADFFVTERENSFSNARFAPLPSAVEAMPSFAKSKKTWYTLDEVQTAVKAAVKEKQAKKPAPKKVAPVKNKSKKIKLKQQ